MTHANKDVTPGAGVVTGILAIGQIVFAFLAFWDLRLRAEDEVNGPKWAWVPAILVNWVGPASYFLFGIRR